MIILERGDDRSGAISAGSDRQLLADCCLSRREEVDPKLTLATGREPPEAVGGLAARYIEQLSFF